MIVIDSDDYAAAGIETMFFPGGEPHVKVPLFKGDDVLFFAKLRTWNDVGLAALVADALSVQASHNRILRLRLFIPYFPGARQDRTDGTAALTLRVMARLFGKLWISVFDAHSNILEGYILANNWNWKDLGNPNRSTLPAAGVIAPDAGAHVRANDYRDAFEKQAALLTGTKHRDSASGALSNYSITSLPKVGHYIIVDDICDGGGTFNLLMEAILKDGCAKNSTFELIVSHGIFSKGVNAIHPKISRITTTDSWCRGWKEAPRLTVVPLRPLFEKIMNGEPINA